MKTGSANLYFLCNFSQLPLSNISLFTVLFTAYAGFFRFFFLACFLVRDMFSSGCRINYPPPPRALPAPSRPYAFCLGGGGILNGKRL